MKNRKKIKIIGAFFSNLPYKISRNEPLAVNLCCFLTGIFCIGALSVPWLEVAGVIMASISYCIALSIGTIYRPKNEGKNE